MGTLCPAGPDGRCALWLTAPLYNPASTLPFTDVTPQ